MRSSFLFLLLCLGVIACQNNTANDTNTDAATTDSHQETPAPSEEMKYTLTPFNASTDYPNAKIESMSLKDGAYTFTLNDSDYQLGTQTPDAEQKMCANSAKGQHIHLIVDNKPYAARYTASFSDYEIEDGEHHLLAFLSRSYHESLKHPGAAIMEKVTTKNGTIEARTPITEPMLFYSRPKGTYQGEKDTKKVMLDFYLGNVTLGTDYKVKAEINGEAHMIDTWQPYYIEGMPMGDNTIKLTLVDANGQKVEAPLNPVERTFTLKDDPITEN